MIPSRAGLGCNTGFLADAGYMPHNGISKAMRFFVSVVSTAGFLLTGIAHSQQTVLIPAVTPSVDAASDTDNTVRTAVATGTHVLGDTITFNSGTLTKVHPSTYAQDAMIRIRNSAHPGRFADVQASLVETFTGSLNLAAGTVRPLIGTLVGRSIPVGSTFTFEFWESFDDSFDTAESNWTNLSFTTSVFQSVPPPTSSLDFGSVTSNRTGTSFVGQGGVQWSRFTLPTAITSASMFSIHTRGTQSFLAPFELAGDEGTLPNDTEMAIYDGINGQFLFFNDDEDFANHQFTSFLPFGNSGLDFLPAGTYFVAVAGFNATFADDFSVTTNSQNAGPVTLDFQFGTVAKTLSGTVFLQDTTRTYGQVIAWELRNGSGLADSGTATLDADGHFVLYTAAAAVPHTLVVKGSHWLAGGILGVTPGQRNLNFNLVNGDGDGDNEVGSSDLSLLSEAFLSTLGEVNYLASIDLDDDGEVGSNDLSILSMNFLETGFGN